MAERNRKQARGGSTRVDIADARGSPMILATFDGGNEFNASRELLDVLNAVRLCLVMCLFVRKWS